MLWTATIPTPCGEKRGSHSRSSLCNHLTMCFSAQSGQGFTLESQRSFSALLVTLESTDPLSSSPVFQTWVARLFIVAASVPHGWEKVRTNEQWLVTLRISPHEKPPFYRETLWTRRWSISNWYVWKNNITEAGWVVGLRMWQVNKSWLVWT